MRELALFAGGGGGLLGSELIGFRTRCAVEIDPKAIDTLLRRQADGSLPRFPVWDDVCTFDGRHWKGDIDVVTGGFPCTDISSAGQGGGIVGKNSRLFFEMLRIIEEVRPVLVFAENSPQLRTKGLGAVLTGLARLGYDARWGVLGARDIGANHHRRRMWIVAANTNRGGKRIQSIHAKMARASTITRMAERPTDASIFGEASRDVSRGVEASIPDAQGETVGCASSRHSSNTNGTTLWEQQGRCRWAQREGKTFTRITDWWDIPRFARVDDGGPNRVDFKRAVAEMEDAGMAEKPRDRNARVVMTGNMQVPAVAALAWEILSDGLAGYRAEGE